MLKLFYLLFQVFPLNDELKNLINQANSNKSPSVHQADHKMLLKPRSSNTRSSANLISWIVQFIVILQCIATSYQVSKPKETINSPINICYFWEMRENTLMFKITDITTAFSKLEEIENKF